MSDAPETRSDAPEKAPASGPGPGFDRVERGILKSVCDHPVLIDYRNSSTGEVEKIRITARGTTSDKRDIIRANIVGALPRGVMFVQAS